MPNHISQKVDANGIVIEFSGGRILTITPAQVRAFFQSTSGGLASRIQQTLAWIAGQIEAFAPAEFSVADYAIDFDFNTSNGTPNRFSIGSR